MVRCESGSSRDVERAAPEIGCPTVGQRDALSSRQGCRNRWVNSVSAVAVKSPLMEPQRAVTAGTPFADIRKLILIKYDPLKEKEIISYGFTKFPAHQCI